MFGRGVLARKERKPLIHLRCEVHPTLADIRIRYFGSLREIIGKRSENVRISDSASVMDLIEKLGDKHGTKFRNFVYGSGGKIREGIAFAVNGDAIASSKLRDVPCKKVDEFVILPPISGGCLI